MHLHTHTYSCVWKLEAAASGLVAGSSVLESEIRGWEAQILEPMGPQNQQGCSDSEFEV